MIVTTDKASLSNALAIASRSVNARVTLPILGYIHLDAQKGWLTLSSTNLETRTDTRIRASVEKPGSVCVPSRTLIDLVSSFPSADVTLKLNTSNNLVTVICGSNKTNIKGLPSDEFPAGDQIDDTSAITLNGAAFKQAVSRVAVAASKDIARPVITGINISLSDKNLLVEAADGSRAARCYMDVAPHKNDQKSAIIPATQALLVSRIPGDEVRVLVLQNAVVFFCGDTTLTIQQIEGRFPDITQITPEDFAIFAKIGRKELSVAAKQVNVITRSTQSGLAVLELNPYTDTATISSISEEVGQGMSTVPCFIVGEGISVGFSLQMIQDFLNVSESSDVQIGLNNATSPVLFTALDDTYGLRYTYLLMPMLMR